MAGQVGKCKPPAMVSELKFKTLADSVHRKFSIFTKPGKRDECFRDCFFVKKQENNRYPGKRKISQDSIQ